MTYEKLKSKKDQIKHKLVDNYEVLGRTLYVQLINDLEQILWDYKEKQLDPYELHEELESFDAKLDQKLEELMIGREL